MASCTRRVASDVGRASLDPRAIIRLTRDADDPLEKPRSGKVLRLRLLQRHFRTVLSLKAKHTEHFGGMEAHGFLLGVRWLARGTERHGARTAMLIDAKAMIGALRKGRTSAPTLRTAQSRCAATVLAADLLVYTAYTPSESNAADWPPRGVRRRQQCSRYKNRMVRCDGKSVKRKLTKLELQLAKHERSMSWFRRWCENHGFGLSANSTNCSQHTLR